MRGQRELNPSARADAYRRALAIIRDQVPAVSIAHTTSPIVFRTTVRGFVPSPDSMISFQDLSLATP
jgi:ABC-type transport system substrate-binding protein